MSLLKRWPTAVSDHSNILSSDPAIKSEVERFDSGPDIGHDKAGQESERYRVPFLQGREDINRAVFAHPLEKIKLA